MLDVSQPQVQGSPGLQGRQQAFGEGMVGGQVSAPPSMQDLAMRYNAAVPKFYRPSGSMNGMGMHQYETTLGGAFGTVNGIAQDNYMTMRYFGKQGPQ